MSLSRESRGQRLRTVGLNLALFITLIALVYSFSEGFVRKAVASPQLDVPYVPTRHEVVKRMLEMAEVKPSDYLIDLGSGDGRIVVAAVKDWNVGNALGIDLDPQRVTEARENARSAGVADRVKFEQGDLFEKNISAATVLTMYLLPTVNLRLRPVILEQMAPGTRVVSHSFDMGDWEPDQHERVDGASVYLWRVPAKVNGRWQISSANGEKISVDISQQYQKISGNAVVNGKETFLRNPLLSGNSISFIINDRRYVGRIEGNKMSAVPDGDAVKDWQGVRI